MTEVKPRSRSRAHHKRGPLAARTPVRRTSPAPAASPSSACQFDAAERRLANYRKQFVRGSDEDLYFRTTQAVVVAGRRWRKIANDRVKSAGQTMARWETLFLVAFSGEDMTQGELAKLIGVEGPTMVRMLDLLAQDGLIERRQSDTDRRVTINRITPQGTEVIDKIMGITNDARAEMLRDIDPKQLATCIDVLTQILRRIDQMI